MAIFLHEYLWTLLTLFALSAAGYFAMAAFYRTGEYLTFTTPLAGLLFTVLGTSAFYSLLGTTLVHSALLAYCLCVSMTIATLFFSHTARQIKSDKNLLCFALIAVGIISFLTNYTTIQLGAPGFLYMDGTDHLSYAQLADWLRTHLVYQQPSASLYRPYESWPDYVYTSDPRFGSYYTMAIYSALRGLSGMFAYDSACAVILSAGMLAVTALFARTRLTFILLFIGLFSTHWFDYSRHGFIGKLLGYPADLTVIGLFLLTPRPFSMVQIALLAALTASASIMHSGLSTGLIFIAIGGIFLTLQTGITLLQHKKITQQLCDDFFIFVLLIGVIIATMGILPRPVIVPGAATLDTTWYKLLPRLFDLETRTGGPHVSGLKITGLFIFFVLTALTALYFLILSIRKKKIIPAALLSTNILLISYFFYKDTKWQADQLIGVFYPLLLCAATLLIDGLNNKSEQPRQYRWALGLLLFVIIVHFPRLTGDLHRYAGNTINHALQFSKPEIEQLAIITNSQRTTIDVRDRNAGIPLLVELGKRNPNLQWTPDAWKAVMAYRSWQAPLLDKSARYIIQLKSETYKSNCPIIYTTIQYELRVCG